jgi:hypothetical protein
VFAIATFKEGNNNATSISISGEAHPVKTGSYSETQTQFGGKDLRYLNLCFAIMVASCFTSAAITYKKQNNN